MVGKLATIISGCLRAFLDKYRDRLLPSQLRALNAIVSCRSAQSLQMVLCCKQCSRLYVAAHSCGNRNCPSCQNHLNTLWIHKQKKKLLRVEYFLVTFTVPSQLRKIAFRHQRLFYSAMFDASSEALKEAGSRARWLGGQVGMSGVLHTHARNLDFHPHIHYLVPAGAWDPDKREWKRKRWKFLFPGNLVGRLFRENLNRILARSGIHPGDMGAPDKWVADCKHVGNGSGAVEYLSRYLYRGVVGESNMEILEDGRVRHHWIDGKTEKPQSQVLSPEDFVMKVLTHVLPQGFRRVRDYGFLHGNAASTLKAIQMATGIFVLEMPLPEKPGFVCSECKGQMVVLVAGIRSANIIRTKSRDPPWASLMQTIQNKIQLHQ